MWTPLMTLRHFPATHVVPISFLPPLNGLMGTCGASPKLTTTPYSKLCLHLRNRAVDARSVHAHFLKTGALFSSAFLCNTIVRAYAVTTAAGSEARDLFDEMPHRNEFTWFTMISSCAERGRLKDAAQLFGAMLCWGEKEGVGSNWDASAAAARGGGSGGGEAGLVPKKFTLGSILKGCGRARDLSAGVQFHCCTVKCGFYRDAFVSNTLIDMYAKCGDIEGSQAAFDQTLVDRNVVTWTSMITGLANFGRRESAFELFRDMVSAGVVPINLTFTSLVKIFDGPNNLEQARQVHGCTIKFGTEVDHVLGSALISMYGRCEGLDEAVRLSTRMTHTDEVSWTSLLVAYMQNGFSPEAVGVFCKMVKEKTRIDAFTVASILGASSSLGEMRIGREVHGYAVRNNFLSDISVANALITFYGKHSNIRKAEMIFRLMKRRDDVSWTSLFTCYRQNDCFEKTIYLFNLMVREGLDLPLFSVTASISACSSVSSLSLGEQMHSRIVRTGIDYDLPVQNSLITMYGKCGNISAASGMFHSMTTRDAISWNAMIFAFSQNGFEQEALDLFHKMEQLGVEPDNYTFLGVLVSCSHLGMVGEGFKYFNSMSATHGSEPSMVHYACMVDILGRAGRLGDAVNFIKDMPCDPDHLVWEALLGSCMSHGKVHLGRIAAEKILHIKPDNSSAYTILANIHASMGMWDMKAQALTRMKESGIRKVPSRSWLEIKGSSHVFTANDESHPLIDTIHQKLLELKVQLEQAGYVPDTRLVLHDIEYDKKERYLLYHSEKLALAFALFATTKGTPIRIMQNLHCCGDCHAFMKLTSSVEDRYIVLRDNKRFHHFQHGTCSCRDYW